MMVGVCADRGMVDDGEIVGGSDMEVDELEHDVDGYSSLPISMAGGSQYEPGPGNRFESEDRYEPHSSFQTRFEPGTGGGGGPTSPRDEQGPSPRDRRGTSPGAGQGTFQRDGHGPSSGVGPETSAGTGGGGESPRVDRMSHPPTYEQRLQSHGSDIQQMRARSVTVKIKAYTVPFVSGGGENEDGGTVEGSRVGVYSLGGSGGECVGWGYEVFAGVSCFLGCLSFWRCRDYGSLLGV